MLFKNLCRATFVFGCDDDGCGLKIESNEDVLVHIRVWDDNETIEYHDTAFFFLFLPAFDEANEANLFSLRRVQDLCLLAFVRVFQKEKF